ncbi:MAG: hypothetical protein NC489_10185 [Ruminococcus flavefaciens]|nr:hypothetical protein [Ruminococcus flavefaciens]
MRKLESVQKTLKSHMPQDICVNDFVLTEMTLAVLEKFAPKGDVNTAYLLLHNYALIGKISETAEVAFLRKAHICLRQCSSKMKWQQLLEQYQDSRLDNIRCFILRAEVKDGKSVLKLEHNQKSIPEPNRTDIYLEYIRHFEEKHNIKYAKAGTYQFWTGISEHPWVEVKIPKMSLDMPALPATKGERAKIIVKISDLLSSAEEMHKILPDDYCAYALKNNIIKTVVGNQVIPAENLAVYEAVNLVGMVGSGKSTLMKVLTYHLSKQDKKVVIVLDTVADVLHMYNYFRKLNLQVSPLVGRNERMKYIYQVMEKGAKYLRTEFSEYLTAPCIVAGMAQSSEAAPQFGKEPCTKLKKDGKHYTCPYLNICPATKMYRDALKSSIVVTTVQGFAAVRIPEENQLFLEYVLQQADLVMFDECDKVQKTLDEFFTPATEFIEFIHNSADACRDDMKQDPEKLGIDQNAISYSELRLQSLAMFQRVGESIQAISGTWEKLLQNTFSAMTLWKQLSDDSEKGIHPISEEVLKHLESVMQETDDEELDTILDYAGDRHQEHKFTKKLQHWLKQNKCEYDTELLQHIKLYLIVVRFDKYVRSLDEAYSFLTEDQKSEMELFHFLQARFTAQQKLLPSAVMGNLFGMKNDTKKGLQLYRQYAFGRALMNRLPWLRMTEEGRPAGPHVLLLSGSSWAEGCLEYHVNVPVRYLLEAESWKRDKLAETTFIDLHTGIRVSGGGQEERAEHLRQVIQKSMDAIEGELSSEGKLLMIVNSYQEARIAVKYLNAQLQERPERAACMIRPTDEKNDIPKEFQVLRGEIAAFQEHSAKILIAPAQAIERGYNIVNHEGHSTFGGVFFLVRPMAVPDEISGKCAKLNGIIESRFCAEDFYGAFTKSKELRRFAALKWSEMEQQSRKSLKYLNDTMKTDITAGLFILILQIFGRLARITNETRPAPKVYFADGAFHTNPEHPDGYDCLNALREYLEQMMKSEEYGEIAKTLYQPFYEAFMRGVTEDVYTDLPYGDDSEYEYDC